MSSESDSAEAPSMDECERREVCSKLEWEGGFDFFIIGREGSDFPQVKDEQFHKLRMAFVQAARELDAHIKYESWLNEFPWVDHEDQLDDQDETGEYRKWNLR
jgi:hypothetical protein